MLHFHLKKNELKIKVICSLHFIHELLLQFECIQTRAHHDKQRFLICKLASMQHMYVFRSIFYTKTNNKKFSFSFLSESDFDINLIKHWDITPRMIHYCTDRPVAGGMHIQNKSNKRTNTPLGSSRYVIHTRSECVSIFQCSN